MTTDAPGGEPAEITAPPAEIADAFEAIAEHVRAWDTRLDDEVIETLACLAIAAQNALSATPRPGGPMQFPNTGSLKVRPKPKKPKVQGGPKPKV